MRRVRRSGVMALAAAAAAVLLGAMALAGAAAVSTGHSGWSWSSPSPQGEDINDVFFTGTTGYAVGSFGTLLRSTDGGQSWTGLPSATTQDLMRVGPVGASGFVTSAACAVRRSIDDGATLTTIDVGGGELGCGPTVFAVGFPDALNGLVLFQDGVVLSTADGGLTLSRRTPVPGTPTDMVVISPTTAFATSDATIYRTTDGAGSWTVVGTAARTLRSITFASAAVGYAAGDGGTVVKTVDGGASWAPIAGPGAAVDLLRVRCASEALCLLTTVAGTSVARTDDGGATYTLVAVAADPVRAVAFASATRAVAAGAGGLVVVSDDGGATWSRVGAGTDDSLTSIAARPGNVAYAVGASAIALTGDGGESWRSFGIPTSRSIRAAAFADALVGYAQDDGGTLRRTLNGGASWQVLDPGPASGLVRAIVPLGGERVLLVSSSRIGRSTDRGETFSLVADPDVARTRLRLGLLATTGRGSRAFLVARGGILRSVDGGRRWQRAALPRVRGRVPIIAAGDCAPPSTCWIVTTGSRVYRTATFGRRWIEVTSSVGVASRDVIDVATVGPREAFLALRNNPSRSDEQGIVLHTADGGRTWAPQLVGRSGIVSIDAVPGRAWALSDLSQAFTTTTGGAAGTSTVLSIRASARVIRRPTRVTISGRLPGAAGGEQVVLYATGFRPRTLTVASSDTFTATYRLTRSTTFVAQWAGDGLRAGDGTPPLTVTRR